MSAAAIGDVSLREGVQVELVAHPSGQHLAKVAVDSSDGPSLVPRAERTNTNVIQQGYASREQELATVVRRFVLQACFRRNNLVDTPNEIPTECQADTQSQMRRRTSSRSSCRTSTR